MIAGAADNSSSGPRPSGGFLNSAKAFRNKKMDSKAHLDATVEQQLQTARLPTLPAIAVKLIELGRSASANIDSLTAIVSQDPAIAANLVRLANSALYHRGTPAGTLTEATSRLGYDRSRVIALSATVLPTMRNVEVPGLPYSEYWRRSLIAGTTARAISRRLSPKEVEATFLSAMLQDIGILLLAQLQANPYSGISADTYTHERAIHCELRLLKEDHAAVGAWWLEQWGFPERVVHAVRRSNLPSVGIRKDKQDTFSAHVRAAGLLADLWMNGGPGQELTSLQIEVSRLLGLDWQAILQLVADASPEIPLVEALCDIQINDAKNLHLALTTLRELPDPEPNVG